MRKQLFEHYVKLDCYRIATQQLCKSKSITRRDYNAIIAKISQAEIDLIMPKQIRSHPRKLTQVK